MAIAVTTSTFKLVIVDDNEMQRYLVRKRFEQIFKERMFSYSIEEEENGKKGWELCKNHAFNFYVIDYYMPSMNGVQLCRKILEQNPEAKIVLYSESNLENIKAEEGLINGSPLDQVVNYIPKDILQMVDFFERFLERQPDLEQFKQQKIEKV